MDVPTFLSTIRCLVPHRLELSSSQQQPLPNDTAGGPASSPLSTSMSAPVNRQHMGTSSQSPASSTSTMNGSTPRKLFSGMCCFVVYPANFTSLLSRVKKHKLNPRIVSFTTANNTQISQLVSSNFILISHCFAETGFIHSWTKACSLI
jgi:hypothetical protein